MDRAPTLIACLTPPGRGAIATLAVRGPRAWAVTRSLFQPGGETPLPEEPPTGQFWFGRLGAELRDEVVLAVKQAGAMPWIEVQCHGGPEVVRLLMQDYAAHGITSSSWQELEQQGPAPRWRQAILPWLVQAATTRTASILLAQYEGAFSAAVTEIVAAVDQNDPVRVAARLGQFVRQVPLGRHLVQPWRVVIAGAPNVGKSSLVNALAGYTRSLVSAIPGTTRDLVTTTLAIDGWPVELTDTAGVRATAQPLESAGIARARQAIEEADLRLWLLDGAALPVMPEEDGLRWHVAINKVDLPPAWDWSSVPGSLRVSAQTKAGLAELCDWLSHALVPLPPEPGEAVPCTPAQVEAIQQARDWLALWNLPRIRATLAELLI